MVTPQGVAFLVDAVAPLCEPLHSSFDKAAEIAHAHFAGYDMLNEESTRELTDLTRAHGRRLLRVAERDGLLGDWRVVKRRRNGQIMLRSKMLRLKVLHVAPFNLVPHPISRARISYFRNPPADFFGVNASRLLGMWAVDDDTGDVNFRIIRPTGRWNYGEEHVGDVDFMLPRKSEDLLSMEFTPDDSEIQLPLDFGDEETNDDLADGW